MKVTVNSRVPKLRIFYPREPESHKDRADDDPGGESGWRWRGRQERIRRLSSINFLSHLHQEASADGPAPLGNCQLSAILGVRPFLDLGRSGFERYSRP